MKKLERIKNGNSLLGGVLMGLSEYFDIDVTVLRILAVGAFFTPIPIVTLYVISWVIMPVKMEYHSISN